MTSTLGIDQGKQNANADALSTNPVDSATILAVNADEEDAIDSARLEEVRELQQKDIASYPGVRGEGRRKRTPGYEATEGHRV